MHKKPIYLDNSTVARPSAEAISQMLAFYTEKWGSPVQPHQKGQELFPSMKEALRSIYKLIGAREQDSVIVTSSSAEAVNHAILSTYQDVTLIEGKNHFISTLIEEAPAMMSLHRLEKFDCPTTFLKPNAHGIITPQALIEAINPRTALFALSWANGLTGVVQPIGELSRICQERGIRFLVDATHVLGKLFFEIKDHTIDFLSFNGEQLHAPQGTGGLYIRHGIKLSPYIVGGIEQAGLRAGVNTPGTIALGVASAQANEARDYLCTEVARLKLFFEKEVLKRIPGALVLFSEVERVPHISTLAFPGVVNEALLYLLNRKGIMASLGGGNQQQINYLLNVCGIEALISASALSFSLSRETSEDELEQTIVALETSLTKLRKASTHLLVK